MASDQNIKDATLAELCRNALKAALEVNAELQQENKYRSSYHDRYPKMSVKENGIPIFEYSIFDDSVTDYSRIFSDAGMKDEDVPSLQRLVEYAHQNKRIHDYFAFSDGSYLESNFLTIVSKLFDRYLHISNTSDFDEAIFHSVYLPFERAIYWDRLPVLVIVPIILIKFELDELKLSENASILRMSEEFQKSRAQPHLEFSNINPYVAGAATHILVLENWEIQNQHYLKTLTTQPSKELTRQIDNFFASCRVISKSPTGYAQILFSPVDWALFYDADLQPLLPTATRSYPASFDNGAWNNEQIPIISKSEAEDIGNLFGKITHIEANELSLAVKRLNRCLLREDEEDSILDAAIGLEALLCSDSNSEITYRLAIRLAAIAKLSKYNKDSPDELLRRIKKIYDYRSLVIHGSSQASKKREIAISETAKIPAVTAAIDLLRMAIYVIVNYPQYLDPIKIDEEIILQKPHESSDTKN